MKIKKNDKVLVIKGKYRGKTGVVLKVGPLPPCSADALALPQVFANLIANSLKYRDPGRKLQIAVSGEKKDADTVIYTVSDNGRGIKAAEQERIWELYYSGSGGGGDGQKGEGIGLPIAKRIVILNGGRIWALSKEGAGADFFIELPA